MKKRYTYNRLSGTDIVVNESMRGVVEKLNWVGVSTQTPKNLLPNTMTTQTLNGVTFTVNANKSITLIGTATIRTEPNVASSLTLEAGKTYKNVTGRTLYFYSGSYMLIDNNQTYTPSSNITFSRVYIRVEINETVNTTIYPMIIINGTNETYEIYGAPTPDYPVPIYSSGDGGKIVMWSHKKNMFDGTFEQGSLSSSTGLPLSSTFRVRTIGFQSLNPSTQYIVNCVGMVNIIVMQYDKDNAFLGSSGFQSIPYTFTSNASARFYKLVARISDSTVVTPSDISNVQFETGSTATTYEPYTGSTTDITTPVGYVGGSLPNGVADSDVQKKIGKVTGVNGTSITINDMKSNGSFRSSVGGTISGTTITFASSVTNATIIYELATPETITITKPQIPTYEGINYITTTNNIKPTLAIEAWKR